MPTPLDLPGALLDGHRRFRSGRYAAERERYEALGAGAQQPATMVIACSDSRAAPETIFDAGPGELFVVRHVAALVPAYAPDGGRHAASAALEYAVLALGVGSIVVLGHGRCGGIAAAIDGHHALTSSDFIGSWVAGIRDLLDDSPDDGPGGLAGAAAELRRIVELRSIEQSIANLRTFPWIRSRESTGRLELVGAWFDIGLGELHGLGPSGWSPVGAT